MLQMAESELVIAVCSVVSDLMDQVCQSEAVHGRGSVASNFKRRKIRKIREDLKLSSDTLDARQQEKERLERLKQLKESEWDERPETKREESGYVSGNSLDSFPKFQQFQPEVIVLSDDEDESSVSVKVKQDFTNDEENRPDAFGRLLINPGHPKDEPDIFLPTHLEGIVKRHQLGGIRFLYENVVETLHRYETSPGFGCILAHSMGLGKTLQVILFVNAILEIKRKKVLIIVPLNTLQNWVHEFERWLPKIPDDKSVKSRVFDVFVLNDTLKTIDQRARVVDDWNKSGGVLLMGYEIFRLLVTSDFAGVNRKKRKKRKRKGEEEIPTEVIDIEEEELHESLAQKMRGALLNPGPSIVVCDEGHRIKNINTATAKTLGSIRTRRRIVLTGYPIQNNLMEYWCMVDFVRPMYLGTKGEFANMFERPIKNGQCMDSTYGDVRLARLRTHVLVEVLRHFVQRRSHSLLKDILPKKTEYVILLRKSQIQHKLYQRFLVYFQGSLGYEGACLNPIKAFAVCCKIWNHPDILKKFLEKSEKYSVDKDLDLPEAQFERKESEQAPTAISVESLLSQAENSEESTGSRPDVEIPAKLRRTTSGIAAAFGQNSRSLAPNYDWAEEIMADYVPNCLENGYKMVVAMCILREAVKNGDKVLLFSQSLFTLNLIEEFLAKGIGDTNIGWKKNRNYFRLDGSTSGMERQRLVSRFNNEPGIHLFLISTRAGSLGINLVGANRVIVFDASWNPCHDAQAVCRIYRYGQAKECFVYRLVTDNSMERAIFNRQVGKQGISDRVVDEKHVDAYVTKEELQNLMTYDEAKDMVQGEWNTSEWCLDDTLLHTVCNITSVMLSAEPVKHESLLLDSREGELTEAEKREAKLSYDEDRKLLRGGGGVSVDISRFKPSSSASGYSPKRFFAQTPRIPPAVAVVRPLPAVPPYPIGPEDVTRREGSGYPSTSAQVGPRFQYPPYGYQQHHAPVPLPATPQMVQQPRILPRRSTEPDLGLYHSHRMEPTRFTAQGARLPSIHHVLTFASNLPSVTYPGMLFPVSPGQIGTLVRTQTGVYLRLQDGHVLDARGTAYDNQPQNNPPSFPPMTGNPVGAVATADGEIRPSCSAAGLIDLCDSSDEESNQ